MKCLLIRGRGFLGLARPLGSCGQWGARANSRVARGSSVAHSHRQHLHCSPYVLFTLIAAATRHQREAATLWTGRSTRAWGANGRSQCPPPPRWSWGFPRHRARRRRLQWRLPWQLGPAANCGVAAAGPPVDFQAARRSTGSQYVYRHGHASGFKIFNGDIPQSFTEVGVFKMQWLQGNPHLVRATCEIDTKTNAPWLSDINLRRSDSTGDMMA